MAISSGKADRRALRTRFGPSFRAKLVAGITAAGEKKAVKDGVNGEVDGLTYFVEVLASSNNAAAATLISKLIPPETPQPETSGAPLNVNVISVCEGNMWAPGKTLLLPYEECGEAHQAYRDGAEAWQGFLEKMKPHLPLQAFEKLASVPAPERATMLQLEKPQLRLVPDQLSSPLQIEHEPAIEARSSEEEVINNLRNEINELAKKAGISLVV